MLEGFKDALARSKHFIAWFVALFFLLAIGTSYKPNTKSIVGIIESKQYIIASKLPGTIEFVHVNGGEKVQKGQLIVTIRSEELEGKLSELKGLLSEQEATLTNELRLFQASSENPMDRDFPISIKTAQVLIENLKEQISILSRSLEDQRIKSPVDGIASQIISQVGENVAAFAPIVIIDDPQSRTIKGYIHESINDEVLVGQMFWAQSAHNKKKRIEAKVTAVSPRISQFPERLQPLGRLDYFYYGREIILETKGTDQFQLGELLVLTSLEEANSWTSRLNNMLLGDGHGR